MSVRRYTRLLEATGLTVVVESQKIVDDGSPDAAGSRVEAPGGSLVDVRPAPGTPIEEGDTVTLTVAG